MNIFPEILGRGILCFDDATEGFDALIHLSHLEIGHATIAVGAYRRELACLGQTVGHGKEVLEIAREPGGKG